MAFQQMDKVVFGSEADEIAEVTEDILYRLRGYSTALFSTNELFWLHHVSSKLRWGTSVERELRLQESVRGLLGVIQQRASDGFLASRFY
jgi:hypothetical protein